MKYLKTYRIFESNSVDEVTDHIDDICMDMVDDGFRIDKNYTTDGKKWNYFNPLVYGGLHPGEEAHYDRMIKTNTDTVGSDFQQINVTCSKLANHQPFHQTKGFNIREAEDLITRLSSYASDEGYKYNIGYFGPGIIETRLNIDEFLENCKQFGSDVQLNYVVISIYKDYLIVP